MTRTIIALGRCIVTRKNHREVIVLFWMMGGFR
jgi:hypothetical protein